MRVTARWGLLGLLVLSVSINYIDRANLSVAAPDLRTELSLSPSHLGLLLSAFFWTYAALQIPAGWLVDRLNVYRVLGFGFLLWSLATALTGFAQTFAMLFALRLVLGLGESVAYPSYSRILAREFPEHHRGTANGAIDAGCKAGPAVGTLVGGLIVAGYGWRVLFFALGFGALLWLIPWVIFMPRNGTPGAIRAEGGPGFGQIFRKRDAWGTFLALFCTNYVWYFILTWLPAYLVMGRKFSTTMMAIYGSLPYWGIAVTSALGGWLSDRWIARGGSPTRVRKTFAATGLLLTTLILPAAMVRDNTIAIVLLTAACLSFGLYTGINWAITQTLAGPLAAGKWTGIQNMFGNLAGVAAPYVTGLLVEKTGNFFLAFAAVTAMLVIAASAYLFIVGRIETVAWSGRTAAAVSGSIEHPAG